MPSKHHENLAARLHRAGFTPEDLASETGGSVRSAYRWIFEDCVPMPVFQRRLRELVAREERTAV